MQKCRRGGTKAKVPRWKRAVSDLLFSIWLLFLLRTLPERKKTLFHFEDALDRETQQDVQSSQGEQMEGISSRSRKRVVMKKEGNLGKEKKQELKSTHTHTCCRPGLLKDGYVTDWAVNVWIVHQLFAQSVPVRYYP